MDHQVIVITYAAYLLISVSLTVWVAQTLHKNGRAFLMDVFKGNEDLAGSVNHLLRVGFYLINLGYISLALKIGSEVGDTRESIEALSTKIGYVLVVLGGMHFFNLYVFGRIRSRANLKNAQPPVGPNEVLGVCVTGGDPLDTDPRTHLCVKSMPQMVSNHVVLTFP